MGRRKGTKNGMGSTEFARRRATAKLMVGVGLVAHLDNLLREILAGDASKLPEFQEFVQYAAPDVRCRLLEKLEVLPSS